MAQWNAQWVSYADDPREELGVFCFRRTLELKEKPTSYPVRLSADQRYKLFVNGVLVCFGPQRGDINHWFYEYVDIGPFLKAGANQISALVWNFGWSAPMAQISLRTAFIMEGDGVSTPKGWQVARVSEWDFANMVDGNHNFYMVIGPGEVYNGKTHPDCSSIASSEKLSWRKPQYVRGGADKGARFEPYWALIPRSIPLMKYEVRSKRPVVRHGYVGDGGSDGVRIDKGRPVLFDYQELICAYPRFALSGAAGTVVKVTYSEAMWVPGKVAAGTHGTIPVKGNRNEVEGKEMRGYQDQIVLGEGVNRFEPLWWRTYRYMRIEAEGPVEIVGLDAVETGYPYRVESSFEANDANVQPIWDIAVRTAERCAGENYFDCPYYEQLQYAGDSRIQALVQYYLSPDRKLARNSVEQFGWSIMESGLTQSRYPNRITQVIPPFCLWWVMMVWDQVMYDADFVTCGDTLHRPQTNIARVVDAIKRLPLAKEENSNWPFADWTIDWKDGVPTGGMSSTIHRLTLCLAEIATARLLHPNKMPSLKNFRKHGPFVTSGDFIDEHPSEHAEALWRLVQSAMGRPMDPWPGEELHSATAAQTSLYFSYYKHQAMQAKDYMSLLGPWKEMIEHGLTTFAETPDPARSDCHAWSANPVLGFFQLVAGVTSVAPAWGRARIAPQPGSLKRFDAKIAHPKGLLQVKFDEGRLELDSPVDFDLEWQGRKQALPAGKHRI